MELLGDVVDSRIQIQDIVNDRFSVEGLSVELFQIENVLNHIRFANVFECLTDDTEIVKHAFQEKRIDDLGVEACVFTVVRTKSLILDWAEPAAIKRAGVNSEREPCHDCLLSQQPIAQLKSSKLFVAAKRITVVFICDFFPLDFVFKSAIDSQNQTR